MILEGSSQTSPTEFCLHAAHIIPREEGKEDNHGNLIALCCNPNCRSIRQYSASLERVGCHDLYDKHGFWPSKQILRLVDHKAQIQKLGSAGALDKSLRVSRPTEAIAEDIQGLLKNEIFGLARRQIDAQLRKNNAVLKKNPPIDERLKLLSERVRLFLQGIVVERKGRLRNRLQKLALRSTKAARSVEEADKSELNRRGLLSWYYYEIGMVSFLLRDFGEAVVSLRNRSGLDPSDRKVLINEAQACIAEFENARRSGGEIASTAGELAGAISSIREICEKESETPEGRKAIEKAVEELRPWLVDSRLHLSRMIVHLTDPDAATQLVSKAEGQQPQRCLEPAEAANELVTKAEGVRNSFDGKGGWEQSVRSVLLLAKGEMHRIGKRPDDYLRAQKYLARAGRVILREKYKEFEYLENVLDGLLVILDKQPAEHLAVGRLRRYRSRLDRKQAH